jgi:glycosyltransferase involved in cell wall biosynthesis
VGGGNVVYYKELATKMGLPEKNICFTGYLGYFERSEILREATVFVNPSFFENCSISILEAMSSGVAVIASDVGGNPEIIHSGENGLLVPPNDSKSLANAVITLLADNDVNQKMCLKARYTIESSFSAEECAKNTFLTYKNILDST